MNESAVRQQLEPSFKQTRPAIGLFRRESVPGSVSQGECRYSRIQPRFER
jgi:hypothetical protein